MLVPSIVSPITRFYDPNLEAPDAQGRTLGTILSWSDQELEACHDYIQTLFPLPEPSPIDPSAPLIDRATFSAFRLRPELRRTLRRSLHRMCLFYGFRLRLELDDSVSVERVGGEICNWVTSFNHNHLRITRIIRCLRVLGLHPDAKAFFHAVKGVYEDTGSISDRSLMYWTRAIQRPLYQTPDDEEEECTGGERTGKDFLYEYEAGIDPWSRREEYPIGHSIWMDKKSLG